MQSLLLSRYARIFGMPSLLKSLKGSAIFIASEIWPAAMSSISLDAPCGLSLFSAADAGIGKPENGLLQMRIIVTSLRFLHEVVSPLTTRDLGGRR